MRHSPVGGAASGRDGGGDHGSRVGGGRMRARGAYAHAAVALDTIEEVISRVQRS
jgi:hypothetical protein